MQLGPERFKANAQAALADRTLKIAIDRTTGTAERKRAEAVADFPEFEAARQRGRRIKDHVIANLDHYLETFERNAVAAGSRGPLGGDRRRSLPHRHRDLPCGGCAPCDAREVDAGRGDRPAACTRRGRHRAGRDRSGRAHHPARRRDAFAHHLAGDAPYPRADLGPVQGARTASRTATEDVPAHGRECPPRAAREVPRPPRSAFPAPTS